MRTMTKWACLLIGLTVTAGPQVGLAAQDDYLDKSLPRDIPVAPYEGERYKSVVPDTLDLVEYADRAINAMTRCLAPEWDYEQYTGMRPHNNPPVLKLGGNGLVNINPKFLEALPGMRVMTGSTTNLDIDGKLMGSIVHVTGKDGLCYTPIENRPWALIDEVTKKMGQPNADIFGEGRQILAYAVWYQHDGNPLWKELAERKMRTISAMTIDKEGTSYFRQGRGYTPWDEDRTAGPVVAIADHGVYEEGMTGSPATYMAGFIPQATSNWYRLTGDKSALELGAGLANYLSQHGKMLEEDTGRVLADHDTHVTHSLLSNLAYALAARDVEMIKWVKRGFEFLIKEDGPDEDRYLKAGHNRRGTGILISDPTCSCFVADMINIGIMLSQAGEGDYWEEVDGWVRNTLSNLQLKESDVERIKAMPVEHKTDLQPGQVQLEDGADRVLGAWYHSLNMPNRNTAIGCCGGNCSRAVYYVWENIIESSGEDLEVNLLMNRASPWAEIKSHLPYEGKVVIEMKKPMTNVLIRIPEWTNLNKVDCKVNEESRDYTWSGGSINVGKASAGDQIVVEFPIKLRTIDAVINGESCKVQLKGNTIVEVTPDLGLPLAHHKMYLADKAPVKEVSRFVSEERFVW